MATLEQLSRALVNADAAGDVEAAKALAGAIRQMQAGQGVTGDMYSSGRVKRISGRVTPQGEETEAPNILGGLTTFLEHGVGDIPIIGQPLQRAGDALSTGLQGLVTGQDPQALQAQLEERRRVRDNTYPLSAMSGGITGNVASFAGLGSTKVGAEALGLGQKLIPAIFKGAASNQAIDTADALTEGKVGLDAINPMAALAGAGGNVLGRGVEKAGEGIATAMTRGVQRRATDAAVRGAPNVTDLKAAASNLFETAKATGSGVKTDPFNRMAMTLVQKAKGSNIDPELDGEAWTLYQRMVLMAKEAEGTGGISFGQLHNLRQLAQDVAVTAPKPRTQRFGQQIVEGIDDLMENIKPADGFVPPNRLGSGANPNAAGNAILEGIGLWSKAKKLSILEEAITKAGYQKSGLENGLRLQFQAILRDARKRKLFTAAELREIEAVAKGTFTGNLMTLLGKFGLGENRIMGPAIGATLFGIPGMLAATGARKLSETMGMQGAQRAANVVASRAPIPTVPRLPNYLKTPARIANYATRGAGI